LPWGRKEVGERAIPYLVNEVNKGIIEQFFLNVDVGENPLRCTT
jgi:hypothetical protein